MPEVSDAFVKKAHALAQAVPALLEKVGENTKKAEALKAQSEMVADTLIEQGLLSESEKSAAVQQLMSHDQALGVLNKTAQSMSAPSMGSSTSAPENYKQAGTGMRESDQRLLSALGFNV